MSEFSNGLTPAQAERLALLAEECGEVVQAIGKVLRHGYESTNPLTAAELTNRFHLAQEAGNVLAAINLLLLAGDLDELAVYKSASAKQSDVRRWLHHADAATPGDES